MQARWQGRACFANPYQRPRTHPHAAVARNCLCPPRWSSGRPPAPRRARRAWARAGGRATNYLQRWGVAVASVGGGARQAGASSATRTRRDSKRSARMPRPRRGRPRRAGSRQLGGLLPPHPHTAHPPLAARPMMHIRQRAWKSATHPRGATRGAASTPAAGGGAAGRRAVDQVVRSGAAARWQSTRAAQPVRHRDGGQPPPAPTSSTAP